MSRKKTKDMKVDDELGARESLKMLLEDDYEVHTFANPLEAFDSIEDVSPSLVLLDITMPGMNGEQLAERLFALNPDLPVLLCTGNSQSVSEKFAETPGVKRVLVKPLRRGDYGAALDDVLGQRR